jgi:hypothetical protein
MRWTAGGAAPPRDREAATEAGGEPAVAMVRRAAVTTSYVEKLLMVTTDYGAS